MKIRLLPLTIPIEHAKDILFISLGVVSAAFGLKSFLLPNHFLDGGIMGISLLINAVTKLDVSILLVVLNIPFIIIGYFHVSKTFAWKTFVAIVVLSLVLAFVNFPLITSDRLLIAFFGGFFLGMGIGLAMRGGCVLDGTEVLAIYTSRKTTFTIGDIILVLNTLIFGAAAYLLNIEIALYAILTFLVASKTVDFVVHGIEDYTSVIVVSSKSDEIQKVITENMGRGVTILKGVSGFGKTGRQSESTNILYSVITRLELQQMREEIAKIDNQAFVVESRVNDIQGGMIKKKPLQK
jgi:uncharacterized membrane-anchored protein YitT (DUF2179 family)